MQSKSLKSSNIANSKLGRQNPLAIAAAAFIIFSGTQIYSQGGDKPHIIGGLTSSQPAKSLQADRFAARSAARTAAPAAKASATAAKTTAVAAKPAIRIDESKNRVQSFKKTAPANAVKPLPTAKVPAKSALKNMDLVKNAGEAALKKRNALKAAQKTARLGKYATRGAMAATGVGLLGVGALIVAEAVIGDSVEDIAIDAAASAAQGKSADKVLQQIGKRLDPATVAANAKKNLDKTGRDIGNAFNSVGKELGKIKIKLPF